MLHYGILCLFQVRLLEKGLRGSWHSGVVIEASNLCRRVVFDELLTERGKNKLVDSVQVTEAIEGLHKRRHVSPNYRGRIRPLPSPCDPDSVFCSTKLKFGLCVDAFYEDAWWEGVIFDDDVDANERSVYFPDEGDELKFSLNHLRISRIWDEFSGDWICRGTWVFLELVGELFGNKHSLDRAKLLWESLQSNYGFQKMISEWTCGTRSLWKKYLNDAYCQMEGSTVIEDLSRQKSAASKVRKSISKAKTRQQAKVDSHPSDTEIQSSNYNGLSSATSNRNGGESVSSKLGDDVPWVPKDAEVNIPVGGVSLMKPRQVRRNCNFQLAERTRRRIIKKRSAAPGGKRNKLFTKNKNNKEQMDAKVKLTPDQEIEVAEKNHVSSSGRHCISRFESRGITLRLKDMVSRSRKRKRKREVKCSSESDTICFVCHGGEELVSCNYCLSSYHWSCLGPKVPICFSHSLYLEVFILLSTNSKYQLSDGLI